MNFFSGLHDLSSHRYRQINQQLLNVCQLDERTAAEQPALLFLRRVLARLFNPRMGKLILRCPTSSGGFLAQLLAVEIQPLAERALARQNASLYSLCDRWLAHADQLSERGLSRLLGQFNGSHNKTSMETAG